MPKIPATLVCLCISLIGWADVRAAAAKPKVVIAHAAMNFRVAPLWVAQDQGFFAKYGIDPEVLYKTAVLKSVMRRLRITEIGLAEDGYQDLLTRGGSKKNLIPLWKECAMFNA